MSPDVVFSINLYSFLLVALIILGSCAPFVLDLCKLFYEIVVRIKHLIWSFVVGTVHFLYGIFFKIYQGMAKCATVIGSAFLSVNHTQTRTGDIEQGLPSNPPELTAAASSNPNSVRVATQSEQQQQQQRQLTVISNTYGINNFSPSALCLNVKEQQQQVLENFNIDWKSYSPCSICLGDFNTGNKCKLLTKCKHVYHLACIDKWLEKEKHCPLCRGSVRGYNFDT